MKTYGSGQEKGDLLTPLFSDLCELLYYDEPKWQLIDDGKLRLGIIQRFDG
jgi:hypothetical protein